MHPEDIKAAMRKRGVTPTALADELGVANGTVSQVISGRCESARIKERIAQITGVAITVLWPEKASRSLRRPAAAVAAARSGRSA
ncbi:helix-turn-helix domain-containing protein [Acidovorax sp. GBBC 3332]|nr:MULTISPECIES: helix-turn-helix domain-containing protein [unclassified Acidovorax]MDA8449817.1 helix-turn-helix domain-containing protein [Acidovorax sp. GBBC 3297]MDA8459262.1 helix-turn-helix domain-containing protein [Acidovorax sp. GBBC 3333]MDA8464299.1 helix-turn-helix domain-containing protein [Acidovorax sp. GBBC 3332]MDA8469491.1 helix-turn-helix domain-containing protein [Acidovorax sp. GBBC 3299]